MLIANKPPSSSKKPSLHLCLHSYLVNQPEQDTSFFFFRRFFIGVLGDGPSHHFGLSLGGSDAARSAAAFVCFDLICNVLANVEAHKAPQAEKQASENGFARQGDYTASNKLVSENGFAQQGDYTASANDFLIAYYVFI